MPWKILLVDDEPNITRALKNTLRKEKYEIFCANWANEAFEIMAREPIDVVVSDEQMPGTSGSVMLTKIRREYPDTVRILLTGHANAEAAMRAINEGQVYRFLQKPCNGLDLVITIRKAIEYKQLKTECRRLLFNSRRQMELLRRLEDAHPGIAQKESAAADRAVENIPVSEVDNLLRMIDAEMEKIEKFFQDSDKTSPSPSTQAEETSAVTPRESKNQQVEPLSREPYSATTTATADATNNTSNRDQAVAPPTPSPTSASAPPPGTSDTAAQTNDSSPTLETYNVENVENIKDLKPIMSRSQVHEILDNCGELKGMSPTVAQILKMTRSTQCSIDKVVKIVKQDHAVSLKVLKIANSAVYTRGEPVDTVQKAVMRIGLSQIRQLVLNIHVIDQFSSDTQDEYISPPQFWEHSIATGLIAAEISRSLGLKESQIDAAFTMGLLHDVGRIVYLEMLGNNYLKVLRAAEILQVPLEQVESRMLLINHADAMDRILHAWGFSKELTNSIALHQLSLGNIRRLAPRTLQEVATLALANRLAHALLLGTSGNLALYPTEEFITTLKLKPDLIRSIEETIPGQTDDIKFSMLASSNQKNWPRLLDQLKQKLQQPFRPIYMGIEPQFDSLRILCDRLRDNTEDEPPNVGVINIGYGRERVPLTTRFKEAEAEAHVENLPLLILSPKGDIQLEDRTMAGRSYKLLPFPVAVSRVIEALNTLPLQCPQPAAV